MPLLLAGDLLKHKIYLSGLMRTLPELITRNQYGQVENFVLLLFCSNPGVTE